jgi:hypothetical protein
VDATDSALANDRHAAVAEFLLLFWGKDALIAAKRGFVIPGGCFVLPDWLWAIHGGFGLLGERGSNDH